VPLRSWIDQAHVAVAVNDHVNVNDHINDHVNVKERGQSS
jgi:hypothetical protein